MKALPFLFAAGLASSAFGAASGTAPASAGPTAGRPTILPPFLTSATRSPADPLFVGTAVDFVSAADLQRRQQTSFASVLAGLPGAIVAQSGASGATSSLFLRGANSNQTLFLVDGIRLNEPNTDYNVFLGGACITACDSLELSHGPQSTLYGGEAIGGVVALRAQRGAGKPSGRFATEGGSFGTIQGAFAAEGERGSTAYNLAVQGGRTDNDRENNSFESANVTFRLDHAISASAAVGGTLRWFDGVYGDPGSRFTNDPDNETRESNLLGTAFYHFEQTPSFAAHIIIGGQDRRFVAESPRAGSATQYTVIKNRRGVVDAQASFGNVRTNRLTGGITAEANHTRNTGFGNIDQRQSLFAIFIQDEWSPASALPGLRLTGGLRSDDFDSFGRATTGRVTAAYLLADRTNPTKFRASYGTGFRSPSFLDLYGQSAFYVGNPALKPERGRGWDAGVDRYFASGRAAVGATWFETEYTDLITSNFSVFPSTVVNVQRARTRGAEFSARIAPAPTWLVSASYTWLDAKNLSTGARLLRRPSHSFGADAWHQFAGGFEIGAGVSGAAGREDIHAQTFATINAEDYAVSRLYLAWPIGPNLTLKARLENALDESYEPVHGYPAPGRGIYGGAEWRW